MNLKEALKAAIDGAKIRHSGWPVGVFVFWNGELFLDHHGDSWAAISSEKDTMDWEIVIKPVKYSVNIWFNDTPNPTSIDRYLSEYLFGGVGWSANQYDGYKKYRITVEAVDE